MRSWWRRAPLAWVGGESGNVLLRFVLVLLAALAIGPLPVAAQVATPERDALGHASAPFGLASITLPTGETGIRATFAARPQAIDGLPRSTVVESADRIQITCGDEAPAVGYPMVIAAVSFERTDVFPPDVTPGAYVAMTLATEEHGAVEGGRDGRLAWVRAEITVGIATSPGTPDRVGLRHTLAWGEVDGAWPFTASADTPEQLDALVTGFVTARWEPRHTQADAPSSPRRCHCHGFDMGDANTSRECDAEFGIVDGQSPACR